jgi:uncharacterized protein (TIGR01244 family)
MSKFIRLNERVFVSPQIRPEDIAQAKSLGVGLVVNNRPDGEAPDQPPGAAIEAAAKAAGLSYVAIPVGAAGIGPEQLDRFEATQAAARGPVLMYCRSGMRSALLQALARARAGEDVDALMDEAADAGYDLSMQRPRLESVKSGR